MARLVIPRSEIVKLLIGKGLTTHNEVIITLYLSQYYVIRSRLDETRYASSSPTKPKARHQPTADLVGMRLHTI